MNNSIWLEHPKYPGYRVSPEGSVLSLRQGRNKLRKPQMRLGYHFLALLNDGVKTQQTVHRLVAEVYIAPIPGKNQVNHINGIKTDNRVENLEWVTPSENLLHSRHVLKQALGEDNGNAKLTNAQVLEIRELLKKGVKHREIALRYGVDRTTVTYINKKGAWSHL